MRIVGKRFWTWMSVWVLSFFIKGELIAEHQEQSTTQEATSTSHQHKGHKVGMDIKKGSQHKMPSPMYTRHKLGTQITSEKMNSGLYDKRKDKMTPQVGKASVDKTNTSAGLKTDAGSKDPAYMRMHKTPKRRK